MPDGYYAEEVVMDDGAKSDKTRVTTTVFNVSGAEVPVEEAMLGAITINYVEGYRYTLVLPKGITFKSTYEDVIAAYGKPDFDYSADAGWIAYMSTGDIGEFGQEFKVFFNPDTKVMDKIYLKNIPSK